MTDDRLDLKLKFKVCSITHFIMQNISNQRQAGEIHVSWSEFSQLLLVRLHECVKMELVLHG